MVFAIATLYLVVDSLLYFALKYTSSCRLVIIGDLQNVRSVDIIVGAASHNMVAVAVESGKEEVVRGVPWKCLCGAHS